MPNDEAKRAAARAAARRLPERGIIGLGTGSTAKLFIEEVGKLVAAGRDLQGVPTSAASRTLAESLRIPLLSDDGPWDIDVCVDGADEVDDELSLIKGGGAALLREKIVNQASRTNIIIVDESKLSKRLGERWAVPVEVVTFGHASTAAHLTRYGKPVLRSKEGHPVRTDAGNLLYDVATGPIEHPERLETALLSLPGVVDVGLFLNRVSLLLIASDSGAVRELSPAHGNPSHWSLDAHRD
jgi:ribose 5-phosphate isomerase A